MHGNPRREDTSPATHEGPEHRNRSLAAPVMRFNLRAEISHLQSQDSAGGIPSGRTLVKDADLRVVLMTLRAGGRMEKHSASGPSSVQAIEGRLRVSVDESESELIPGELLVFESGIPHDLLALEDSAFLLTIGRTTYHQVSDHHEVRPNGP